MALSVSYSTTTASAASAAADFEVATTAATMSPTNRTTSFAKIGRLSVGGIIGKPWNDGSPRSFPAW